MNQAEWQARVDLAAALRLAVHFGLNEAIDNHFSYAIPGKTDRFLLNPYGLYWSEIRASDLLEVDAEGNVVSGDGIAESTAFCIHSRIHLRHPNARCVLHTHMPYATSLSLLEDGRLEPVSQTALMFYNDVAYDDGYNGLGDTSAEGDRMAEAMDGRRVLFLSGHGVIVAGETIAKAFADLYYLERACQAQVLAMSTGRPLKPITDNIAASTFGGHHEELSDHARVHFDALKRSILEKQDPGYAQ
ncbi:MAG: aldolase [Kiloniellales bacterium]|nr:aldolase [Kiloniellales bacterium]